MRGRNSAFPGRPASLSCELAPAKGGGFFLPSCGALRLPSASALFPQSQMEQSNPFDPVSRQPVTSLISASVPQHRRASRARP
jgi:hypothetical protein